MKRILLLLALLALPVTAHAGNFTFKDSATATTFSINTTQTTGTVSISTTSTKTTNTPIAIWKSKVGQSGFYNSIYADTVSFSATNQKKSFSLSGLAPSSTYYITYLNKFFQFTTDQGSLAHTISLQGTADGLKGTVVVPATEKRALLLRFNKTDQTTALVRPVPQTTVITSGNSTTYSFTFDGLATILSPEDYIVSLEVAKTDGTYEVLSSKAYAWSTLYPTKQTIAQSGSFVFQVNCSGWECDAVITYSGVSRVTGSFTVTEIKNGTASPLNRVFEIEDISFIPIPSKDHVVRFTIKPPSVPLKPETAYRGVLSTNTGTTSNYTVDFTTPKGDFTGLQYTTKKLEFRKLDTKSTTAKGVLTLTNAPNGYKGFSGFQGRLYYSSKETTPDGIKNDGHFVDAYKDTDSREAGFNTDGSYHYNLAGLTPSTSYWTVEVVTGPNGLEKVGEVQQYNTERGLIVAGSTEDVSNFEKRTYRLLAPLPNLSMILDPELCAEKEKAGTLAPGAICDINDLITYAMQFLVGLTAVFLVVRIVIEGYNYMVTDIPGIKISAKTKIMEMVFGLLLALGAYLILNTLNPKLVSNTTTINSVAVGTTEKTYISPEVFEKITGRKITPKPELLKIVNQVAKEKNVESCVIQSIIQQESPNWNESAVGCDENVRRAGIGARSAFIASGITLSGKKFTERNVAASIVNDNFTQVKGQSACHFDAKKPGYNLDWRFSKGFGLSQNTINPKNAYASQQAYEAATKEGGELWLKRSTPPSETKMKELLSEPKKQVEYIVDHLKSRGKEMKCGNDIQCMFSAYNGSGPAAERYGREVKATYDRCKTTGQL